MAISVSKASTQIHPPALKWPVKVKVFENDPAMNIKASGMQLSIKGVANNRGTVASFASFEVGTKKINIQLKRGMTGANVLTALKRQLPTGYSVMGTPSSFQIMRG